MNTENSTHKMLTINVALTFAYSIIAVITGIMVASQTILAEGISNLGAVPLALLNIIVVKFIARQNAGKYPFGKDTLEPFVGIPSNCFLLVICITIIVNSVQMLLASGNDEVRVTSSILFGVFSFVYNTGVYRYYKSLAKDNPSPIVIVTLVAWKFSATVGLGIVLGFGLSWVLSLTPLNALTPYIDPALAVILMLVFASSPVVGIRDCVKELMQTNLPNDMAGDITERIEKINNDYDFSDRVLRLAKVGSKIIVEVDYVVRGNSQLDSVSEQDRLRGRFAQAFAELPYKIWMNVNFTSEAKWTEHVITQS